MINSYLEQCTYNVHAENLGYSEGLDYITVNQPVEVRWNGVRFSITHVVLCCSFPMLSVDGVGRLWFAMVLGGVFKGTGEIRCEQRCLKLTPGTSAYRSGPRVSPRTFTLMVSGTRGCEHGRQLGITGLRMWSGGSLWSPIDHDDGSRGPGETVTSNTQAPHAHRKGKR